MPEVFVLVERKNSLLAKFFSTFMVVLTVIFVLLATLNFVFMIPALLLSVVCVVLRAFLHREFEYSYFDGDVRFARITNKSRRKALQGYSMEEVLQIAPAGDRSMHKYENDSQVKKKDYTSGIHNVPYYEMAVKTTNGISLIKFEPDDKYLDAVCMKFPQKVIRK